MAEHEPSIGATSEWFTPPEYFEGPEPRPCTAKTGKRQSNQVLVPNRPAAPLSFSNFLQINSGTRGTGLLRVLVPPISYEE
jgi:hypothetical protein